MSINDICIHGNEFAEHRWVLLGHLRSNFGIFVRHFFLCLSLHGRRELYPACQKHLHPDIETNFVAIFVRWDHIVRYNMSRLWLTICEQNITVRVRIACLEYLQRFMLHAMVVLCDSEFATLARFITRLVLPMATLNELVFLPETISLIIACDFVLETGVLHLKPEDVMEVKVRWLELHSAKHRLHVLFHLLELFHALLGLRRAKPAPALISTV